MPWLRIIILTLVVLVLGSFLHYTLPQRDIVRITSTEIIRQDFSALNRFFYARSDSGGRPMDNRDLRLINTVHADGEVRVYRNEDTGLGWPPYFKLDSSDLHAEASNLVSTSSEPRWVVITHYGWRSRLLTTYPNAVALREVDGPDVTLIPWLNLVILALLAAGLVLIWRLWERFIDRFIDPVRDGVAVRWAKFKDRVAGRG